MNRKIKTWAYAILLLNIIAAGIGIAMKKVGIFFEQQVIKKSE